MAAFIIVSGLPASGKTSLATVIARQLGLPHLDKDAILEDLFDTNIVHNNSDRHMLSRRADVEFEDKALQLPAAVLSSWWRHPASNRESGTPTAWLGRPNLALVELHCQCLPAVAVQRFVERKRHPSHLDHLRNPQDLLIQFLDAGAMGPLFPEAAISVDTSQALGAGTFMELIRKVQARLEVAT